MKAFPHEEWLDSTDPHVVNPIRHTGMDLRDYFAASALQGLFSLGTSLRFNGKKLVSGIEYAKLSYEIADEMMEARNGNNE